MQEEPVSTKTHLEFAIPSPLYFIIENVENGYIITDTRNKEKWIEPDLNSVEIRIKNLLMEAMDFDAVMMGIQAGSLADYTYRLGKGISKSYGGLR